jgi:chemotaxis protein MotB
MKFSTKQWAILGAVCVLPTLVGCNDKLKEKDAQIALIEDANHRLTDELAQCRVNNEQCESERAGLNQRVASFRGQIDDLSLQLASKPEPAPVSEGWQAVPGGAMIAIEGNVLFAPGKPALRASGHATLDAIASAIRGQYASKDVFVFGHTDDTPIKKSGWKDNFELSAQRALSVVRYLRDRGIDPGKLVACGAGEFRPRLPNTNNENRAKNRRVEIFAVEPVGR